MDPQFKTMSSNFKIFVSPFKGGSTSTAAALEMVGFKRAKYSSDPSYGRKLPKVPLNKMDWSLINSANNVVDSFGKFSDIPKNIAEEVRKLIGSKIEKCMDGFDFADDWPIGHDAIHPFIKKIVFENSKFIFVERPMDQYIESVENHCLAKQYKHIYKTSRYLFLRSSLGKIISEINYKKWKSSYLSLKEDFPKDVLIMDLEDGWLPLACFLDFEIPDKEFPWKNKYAGLVHIEDCGHELEYCEKYDSEYCPICLKWADERCDSVCSICNIRPDEPGHE